jgi:hypothetical protein
MDWARILADVTGTVDQELLARNVYLATYRKEGYGVGMAAEDSDQARKFFIEAAPDSGVARFTADRGARARSNEVDSAPQRHARACRGHLRLSCAAGDKSRGWPGQAWP